MATSNQQAMVSLSIDLELEIAGRSDWLEDQLSTQSSALLQLLRSHQFPATWCVADPAASAAVEGILASNAANTVAVLADRSWLGTYYPLAWQSAELTRRFGRARQAGLTLSTLALHNVEASPSTPLLRHHGIETVRLPAKPLLPGSSGKHPPDSSLQASMGLVEAWEWPARNPWWSPWKRDPMHQAMRMISQGIPMHWVIDGQQLATQGDHLLSRIDRTVTRLLEMQKQSQLLICTLEDRASTPRTRDAETLLQDNVPAKLVRNSAA